MLNKAFLRTVFLLALTNPACLSVAGKHVVFIPENANIAAAVASAPDEPDVEFDIEGIVVPHHAGAKMLKVRATSAFGKDSTYSINQEESLPLGSMRQVLISVDDEESLAVISVDVNGGEAAGFMTVGQGQDSLFGLKQSLEGGVKASDPEAFTRPKWSCGVDDLLNNRERRTMEKDGAAETHHHDHGDEEHDHAHLKPGLEGLQSFAKSLKKANIRGGDNRRLTTSNNYFFEVKIFLEIDSAFYNDQGQSVINVMNYVNLLVSAANKIFEKEILTHLTIQHVKLYTTESLDPYSSAATSLEAVELMRLKYNSANSPSTFGGGDGEIDIHHGLFGKDLGGGIAYQGTLCNKDYGFGVSAGLLGQFNNPTLDPNVQGMVRWSRDLLCRDE
jgi:hypothetical protein